MKSTSTSLTQSATAMKATSKSQQTQRHIRKANNHRQPNSSSTATSTTAITQQSRPTLDNSVVDISINNQQLSETGKLSAISTATTVPAVAQLINIHIHVSSTLAAVPTTTARSENSINLCVNKICARTEVSASKSTLVTTTPTQRNVPTKLSTTVVRTSATVMPTSDQQKFQHQHQQRANISNNHANIRSTEIPTSASTVVSTSASTEIRTSQHQQSCQH